MPSLLTYWQSNYRPKRPLVHQSVSGSNEVVTSRSAVDGLNGTSFFSIHDRKSVAPLSSIY